MLQLIIWAPLINFLLLFVKKENGEINQKFAFDISKIFSIMVLVFILILMNKSSTAINILNYNSEIFLSLKFDKNNLRYLLCLNVVWILLLFYCSSYFSFSIKNRLDGVEFIKFLPIFIFLANNLILSNNLLTLILFQSFLTMFIGFYIQKSLVKNNVKSKIFIYLLIGELFFLSIFFIFISNFASTTNFSSLETPYIKSSSIITYVIFVSFFLANFLTIFIPSFLLIQQDFNQNSLKNFVILALFFGFAKIFILVKVVTKIISVGLFSLSFSSSGLIAVESIFAISILSSLISLLLSHDFRKIFFYLIFNQINILLLTVFIAINCDYLNYEIFIFNFLLFALLLFFILSNLILYLKNSKEKEFEGIFYSLKINISLLIFTLLNFSSLFWPNLFENFTIIKLALNHKFFISFLLIILNSLGILLFLAKLIFPTFRQEIKISAEDIKLAKKIDYSSYLSLTAFLIFIIIILVNIFN